MAVKLPAQVPSDRFRQRLSQRESCQSRQALTERARTLRDQQEQTEGVFPGYQLYTRAVNCAAMPKAPSQRELAKPSGFD